MKTTPLVVLIGTLAFVTSAFSGDIKYTTIGYTEWCYTVTEDGKGVILGGGDSSHRAFVRDIMYGDSSKGLIICPDTIDGLPVVEIAPYAFYQFSTTRLFQYPETVVKIGDYAFYECTTLEDCSGGYHASVTNLGAYAFYRCKKLERIRLAEGLREIPEYAFCYCSALELIEGTRVDYRIPASVTRIGNRAFSGCTNLGTGFVVCRDWLLAYNTSATPTSLTVPEGVTRIAGGAFYDVSGSLQKVTIPEGVTLIDDGAFGFCSKLTTVNIPSSVTLIGRAAFTSCTALGSGPIVRDGCLLYCNAPKPTESYTVPDGVRLVAGKSFVSNPELKVVKFPASVKSLGDEVFFAVTNLESVVFRGDAPATPSSPFGEKVPESCRVVVHAGTSGWQTDAGGKWYGRELQYVSAAPEKVMTTLPDGRTVSIPYDYIAPLIVDEEAMPDDAGFQKLVNGPAPNGVNTVLEAYVAGLDLTKKEKFLATLTMKNGLPYAIEWTPKLPEGAAAVRTYKTYGATDIVNPSWKLISDGNLSPYKYFRVDVNLTDAGL